jgi:hypothetical protein
MRTITALSVALVASSLASSVSAYQFTTIDHPESAGLTYALGVNDQGDVAGAYLGFDGVFHGYVLEDGEYRAIDVPGASQTICGGIEESGRVTGTYFDAQGFQHGFTLDADQFTSIDVPGAGQITHIFYEFGTGLGTAAVRTAHGLTVGWYADPAGDLHGFLDDHGTFQTIDAPGVVRIFPGYGTQPIALNDRGEIGGSYVANTWPPVHGFVLRNGEFTTFDAPGVGGSFGTQVNGMNNRGDIAGPYTSADDHLHGFVYSNGQFTTVDVPGALHSEVDSINDAGIVSGTWYGADGSVHGYVATP